MPIDYNPVWSSTISRDDTYSYDSADIFELTDSASVFLAYLIGNALLIADLAQERNRQFAVLVDINGTNYDNTTIVEFEIENSLALEEEFEIGTAILSKLILKIKTANVIAPNAKVIPYLAMIVNGERVTDWYPMGEFYIDNREQIKDVWEFTCYDKLVYADVPYVSALSYPTTQQAVWDEICTSLGYIYDSSVVIDPTYQIQAGPAGYSKRQMLGYIASANGASVYISKGGLVRFKVFNATDAPVSEMTDADYIRAVQTNPEKIFTKIVVTYNTEDQLTYIAGIGDENHTLYIENPFATQTITNDLLTKLNGFSYIPVEMDARGYPQIEAGDRLRFGVYVSTPTWEGAAVTWQDANYSWDGYSSGGYTNAMHTVYSFKGGLKMSVEAQSKSDQKSEFVVEGTLTAQVNKLNLLAVRENKSYFGVTITRTEGIIVEREDHFSKAIFNSDEFAMKVGDGLGGYTDAVYFDPILKKYKFNGTLEAADGVFSGSLNAATGTFTGALSGGTISIGSGNNIFKADSNGIYSGHAIFASAPFSVNMAGNLIATSATITGTINATGGTFSGNITASGTITGGAISGATITGGTIIGATIQTAADGLNRVVLQSGLASIQLYSGNNVVLYMTTSGALDSTIYNIAGGTMLLGSGTHPTRGLGDWTFYGAVNFLGTFKVHTGTAFDTITQSGTSGATLAQLEAQVNLIIQNLRSLKIYAT